MISSASYKIFSDQGRYCVAVLLYETPSSYLRVHRDTIPISYNLLDRVTNKILSSRYEWIKNFTLAVDIIDFL